MDNMVFCQIDESFEYIFNVAFGFVLLQRLLVSHLALQISLVAELSYYVTIPIAGEDLMAPEDIGMVELL